MGPQIYLYWNVMNVKSILSEIPHQTYIISRPMLLNEKKKGEISFTSLCLILTFFSIAGGF